MKNKLKYGLTLVALAFLVGCSNKESIQRPGIYQYYPLPDETWAIAVGNNKYLEKLTLPEQYQGRKVTQIAENGFKDCKALREIGIPSSVLNIGNRAFYGCSALASINIPNSVTTIGKSAFEGCSSLTSIVIPNSVTTIGAGAFYGCSRLTICCQAQSKPSGWDYDWRGSGFSAVW